MSVLAAERIKLFSTRSPWWCSGLAVGLVIGLTALILATGGEEATPPLAIIGPVLWFGMVIVMVMAALSVTTEYRFGTIRSTFQAVPDRNLALLSKTVVVGLLGGAVGLVAGFGAWALAYALRPDAGLALDTAAEWRAVAGAGVVYAVGAVLAVAVGILLRQTAGAVSLLLVWTLLVENLVGLIPNVGDDIQKWLPFLNANNFLSGPEVGVASDGGAGVLTPWASLAFFAAFSAVLLVVALVVANRRDA